MDRIGFGRPMRAVEISWVLFSCTCSRASIFGPTEGLSIGFLGAVGRQDSTLKTCAHQGPALVRRPAVGAQARSAAVLAPHSVCSGIALTAGAMPGRLKLAIVAASARDGFCGLVWEGKQPFYVDSLALPVEHQDRLGRDLRREMDKLTKDLRRYHQHGYPSRGDDLYQHLELDEAKQETKPYFDAREHAISTAEKYFAQAHHFFKAKLGDTYSKAVSSMKQAANVHIL